MCAPSEQQLCRPGAQLRMGVVTQIGDLDNTSTRVRPYEVKVRFGLFARLQMRRTVWINRIFQCDRRGDPCGLPFHVASDVEMTGASPVTTMFRRGWFY